MVGMIDAIEKQILALAPLGPEQLSTHELLQIICPLFAPDWDTASLTPAALGTASLTELQERGFSAVDAVRLQAAFELARRSCRATGVQVKRISGAADVLNFARGALLHLEHEELHVLGLDTLHQPKIFFRAAQGTLNRVFVEPKDVFRRLLREAVCSVIIVHNHPSGSPLPSEADQDLTARLSMVAELVGIPLLDHVIIGREGHYSFAESGRLKKSGTKKIQAPKAPTKLGGFRFGRRFSRVS